MIDLQVTLELALQHGLTSEEFKRIVEILGRTPSYTELGIYSVMWSEHCSYKNSIAEIKKLPRSGPHLLANAGDENAGLVDIGDGLAVAFKIESHNHPSAVEPYQGAATGVGGILRDIFTMGARPIAALNSLRFGNPKQPKTQHFMRGIVKGIGDYGNSFGVPTVGGDTFFADCYEDNPLVNAMAVGIVAHSQVARAVAKGEGNLVLIVGSLTGRDGIHGATFASEEITEESEQKRPSVQVGDPFTEKLLLEATLETIRAGYALGIQDMGAAGITCSASEMSAKGGSGIFIDLDRVPTRESNMTSYEIMLSESQERMLIIVSPENEGNVRQIFSKWDLSCEVIGSVTSDGVLRVQHRSKEVAAVPSHSLVLGGGAPVYHPSSKEPEYIARSQSFDTNTLPVPGDYNAALLDVLGSPNVCSRGWIVMQYDSMVLTNSARSVNADAAVVRIKGTSKALAFKTDGNPRYVYLNPYRGGQIAVAEAARNVACVGAKPLAITNCLNFGTPTDPEIFWQFKEAIRGIGDACRELNTPVTGGNVSFYNENSRGAIYPSPIIGMLGIIENHSAVLSPSFKSVGDIIIIIGTTRGHLGGSEYLALQHRLVLGDAPMIDLQLERQLQATLRRLINNRLIQSAHDVSEGGIAVALAECALSALSESRNLGAAVEYHLPLRTDHFLFGEDQSRIVITVSPSFLKETISALHTDALPHHIIGTVVQDRFTVNDCVDLPLRAMGDRFFSGF